MTMAELKPCPFCGSPVSWDRSYTANHPINACIFSGTKIVGEDGDDLIRRWNMRPSERESSALSEEDRIQAVEGMANAIALHNVPGEGADAAFAALMERFEIRRKP